MRGYVACHASGGVTLSDRADVPAPRNSNTSPPGLTKAWSVESIRDSTRTARTETRLNVSWKSGRANSSSNRAVTTSAPLNPRVRTTSRRKTDFRVFDSTIKRHGQDAASASGIAGEPPPVPMSSIRSVPTGTYRAATTGSINRRSSASAGASDSFRPVRLIFAFQLARRR